MRRIAFVLLSILGAACSAAPERVGPGIDTSSSAIGEPPPPGVFTTNSTSYRGRLVDSVYKVYKFTVVTRYTNPTSSTIYLERCYPASPIPIYGVLLVSPADSVSAYSPAWACVGHEHQIGVPPGATRVDTLELTGPNAFDNHTFVGLGVLEGRMRLGFSPMSCSDINDRCPINVDSLRYSNEFTVQIAR